ncbi:MAG: DHH family phosphoesterase [Firmicutes bacterium]|nr:DHH family phosphoesterase [Bacillota bacterium]
MKTSSIKEILNSSKSVLIVGHIRPDGDCLGAGLALYFACKNLGVPCDFVCDTDPLPKQYSFMNGFSYVNMITQKDYDTVIAVDCGSSDRLGKYLNILKKAKQSVNIDHHPSNDNFAKINIVDKTAAAACEIVSKMLIDDKLVDKQIAENLLVGLSTDTGHFIHSNVKAEIFELVAKLLSFGVDYQNVISGLYKSYSKNQNLLLGRVINSARYFENDKIGLMMINQEDLDACECGIFDTEGLIGYLMRLGSIEVAACICECGKDKYKVGFRSKSFDVGAAAAVFGGGGHKHAAGCMVFGKKEDVIDKVKKSLMDCF